MPWPPWPVHRKIVTHLKQHCAVGIMSVRVKLHRVLALGQTRQHRAEVEVPQNVIRLRERQGGGSLELRHGGPRPQHNHLQREGWPTNVTGNARQLSYSSGLGYKMSTIRFPTGRDFLAGLNKRTTSQDSRAPPDNSAPSLGKLNQAHEFLQEVPDN